MGFDAYWRYNDIKTVYITLHFKGLRGSVDRAHIHVGYIFLNSNEEIVVQNPKSKIFF